MADSKNTGRTRGPQHPESAAAPHKGAMPAIPAWQYRKERNARLHVLIEKLKSAAALESAERTEIADELVKLSLLEHQAWRDRPGRRFADDTLFYAQVAIQLMKQHGATKNDAIRTLIHPDAPEHQKVFERLSKSINNVQRGILPDQAVNEDIVSQFAAKLWRPKAETNR